MAEDAEAKRWLIDRVDGMVEGLRLQLEDEYDAFAGLVESISDSLMDLRNNALTLIAFLFTLAIALATLKVIDLVILEYSLIILAFIAIAVFFALNSLHSFFMSRLEQVENAYLGGINILHYLWGSYYSGGTMNFESTSTETIHVLDEYAKVVVGALYSNVLSAYEGAIGSTLRGEDRDEFRKAIKQVSGYTERSYEKYKVIEGRFVSRASSRRICLPWSSPSKRGSTRKRRTGRAFEHSSGRCCLERDQKISPQDPKGGTGQHRRRV